MISDFQYPAELPVCAHREEILATLQSHNVVIVCGETGSGKTTQLPKMSLEYCLKHTPPSDSKRPPHIVCTQPRRLAAVTMAERVASELQSPVGGLVGYQHRYARAISRETCINFMTDGVLLAETRSDALLRRYDVIIVDEAHERSLNIDFLLGILKRVLLKRRNLKVIISSATLDVAAFSVFFNNAPIINVPGRLYPVTIRYLPPNVDEDQDLAQCVARAVAELPPHEDILVFLPGERDIRESAEVLARMRPDEEVIPLLASLPASEQKRAFRLSLRRRIVLATNVAETSVTIPGIRCVIDSGLARISRYIHRTGIQRLQVEAISQASARQRAGRCGRLGPGTCLRLYSEEDFVKRDDFTPPEIQRSSLAGVILTMLDLRLGDIARFPFLDPPKSTNIREGFRELIELGAVTHDTQGESVLTEIGRKLARIPIEPRYARMLLAAAENGVLAKALPLVASFGCDDPRRRPVDEREKALEAHAAFRVAGSDFLSTLTLWNWWHAETKDLSQSKARALCKKKYLSYPKMREWLGLTRQLEALLKRLNLSFAEAPEKERDALLHRAILTGLLGRIGKYDPEEENYRGAHGLRFILHPSSVLTKKVKGKPPSTPPWIVAAELLDTARLFACNAAILDPTWIEPAAKHLCRYSYHSPMWDPLSGFVRATEQVTLYGLVIIPARRCDFSRVNLPVAREIFIRDGLVEGAFPQPPPMVRENNKLLDALRCHVAKIRKPEYFNTEKLIAFFDRVLPPDIASANALRKWLGREGRKEFLLKKSDWWPPDNIPDRDFPDHIRIGDVAIPLTYQHDPDNSEEDGITCTIPQSHAAILRQWRSEWLVPGALPEKLAFLISSLPSALRRVLSPVNDIVAGLLLHLKPGTEPLQEAVRRVVLEEWGFRIAPDAWNSLRYPNHLVVRFRIVDDKSGRTLALSRDLEAALREAKVPLNAAAALPLCQSHAHTSAHSSDPHTTWDFGDIPASQTSRGTGWDVTHYPALCDMGSGVILRLFENEESALRAHDRGITRLYMLTLGSSAFLPFRRKDLSPAAANFVKSHDYASERIAADILMGAIREALVSHLPPIRTAAEFQKRIPLRRPILVKVQLAMAALLAEIFDLAGTLEEKLEIASIPESTRDSLQTQLAWLLYRGFPARVTFAQLKEYPRYLKGAMLRLERAHTNPTGDCEKENHFAPHWARYHKIITAKSAVPYDATALETYRWMVEEYRISLFAQELHTPTPISPKRLDAQWEKVGLA